LDPEIKRECILTGPVLRPASTLVDRHGTTIKVREESGEWTAAVNSMSPFESMFTHIADPRRAREVIRMRDFIRSWRLYDHFRVDAGSLSDP
jgi:predicted ATPase